MTWLVCLLLAASPLKAGVPARPTVVGSPRAWGSSAWPGLEPTARFVRIAVGFQHTLAIDTEGKVMAWGKNEDGQSTVPEDLSGVVGIAAGTYHSLAVRADGTVVAWGAGSPWMFGDPHYGQSSVPEGLGGVVAVAAGGYHSLALKADGTVVAWGAGSPGTFEYPHYGQSTVPPGLSGVVALAAGAYHSLALKSNGTVVAWGAGSSDLIEPQQYGQSLVPEDLGEVLAVSAGFTSSFALLPIPPALTIQRTLSGSIVVAWPATARDWVLQGNAALGSPGWAPVGLPLTDEGTSVSVTLELPAGARFFRLQKP